MDNNRLHSIEPGATSRRKQYIVYCPYYGSFLGSFFATHYGYIKHEQAHAMSLCCEIKIYKVACTRKRKKRRDETGFRPCGYSVRCFFYPPFLFLLFLPAYGPTDQVYVSYGTSNAACLSSVGFTLHNWPAPPGRVFQPDVSLPLVLRPSRLAPLFRVCVYLP